MKKKRSRVEQMVGVLKQTEGGVSVAKMILRLDPRTGIYRWKAKSAGLR